MTDASEQALPRRPRGRPRKISRDAIARAALKIGIENATIPAIAAHLQVDHSSLYHHVKGRNDLISVAAELAIDELEWRPPAATNWRDELIILTDALWALYDRNPGLAEAIHRADITPSTGIHSFAESVKKLQDKGFSLDNALVAVDMLVDMVGESFLGWWATTKLEADGRTRKARIIEIWQAEAENIPENAKQINGMIEIMTRGTRGWWVRKRDLVLDGIAVSHARDIETQQQSKT